MSLPLGSLIHPVALKRELEAGYVRRQDHLTLPLAILNYTHRCQYDRAWNEVTRQCRGLIYDTRTGELVARPWPKFHNYGEHDAETLDLEAPVVVTDKLDGSLGILYRRGDASHAVATRGSFSSEQALHATEIWAERYSSEFYPDPDLTYLFEIVYPGNRVVVDYGDLDDLVLLGAVETETGICIDPREIDWPGLRVPTLSALTLAEALEIPPRANCEGVVVRFTEDDTMVKLKQEDYVELHRIVTGLNDRSVWEHLGQGGTVEELCERLPDEFHDWVKGVAAELNRVADELISRAYDLHSLVLRDVGPEYTRKD